MLEDWDDKQICFSLTEPDRRRRQAIRRAQREAAGTNGAEESETDEEDVRLYRIESIIHQVVFFRWLFLNASLAATPEAALSKTTASPNSDDFVINCCEHSIIFLSVLCQKSRSDPTSLQTR